MAFDKKPSTYPDHGAIGSAEELDAYGVWVKSEPQDLTASLAEAVNIDAEAVPFEADFDAGFFADFDSGLEDFGSPNFGIAGLEPDIPEVSIEGEASGSFDEGITAESGQHTEAASTHLLMKIAEELSLIRSELSTLKKEFSGIRTSAAGVKEEAPQSGFFTGDDDEKIALTGDEMENILSSADYSGEEELGEDPFRKADEAALKKISEHNESLASEESNEEINIDFAGLGVNLDNDLEEAPEELPPLEAATDDFETLSLGDLSLDESPAMETGDIQEETADAFAEELVPLDDDHEELRNLRMEGAIPLTPPPDNPVYLEEDPFTLDDDLGSVSFDEEISTEKSPLEETTLDEAVEETAIEEPVAEEPVLAEEPVIAEEPVLAAEPVLEEEPVVEEAASEETVSEETASPGLISGEGDADLSFDDVSFDLDFDDFSGENTLSLDDNIDQAVAAPPAESLAPLEEPALEEPAEEVAAEEEAETAEEPVLEAAPAEEASDEPDFDVGTLDLSDAVIDEPDLSAGLVEPPLEEPVLGDISFKDDISLEMDDFGEGIDLDVSDTAAKDTGKTGGKDEAAAIDDSLAQVIPEGFEVNAEEAAVSLDDDLEGFADDLAIAGEELSPLDTAVKAEGGDDLGIPTGLKSELKSVLSYMDHLLESLPEDKIEEFAKSEYFDSYKKIFKELGLV